MNFVSMAEFYDDIAKWERQLPQFDAVVGVPRSGLIPATYIALRRNIRMVELTDLIRKPEGAIERAPLRQTNPIVSTQKPFGNRLLIVDDSSSRASVTFTDLRDKLKDQTALNISYGAVYRMSAKSRVDYYHREVPHPRVFAWNWPRHWVLQNALLDFDGVLCEDWQKRPEKDQDPEFVQHMKEVKPLYIPDVPVRGVVTSRLERYRPIAEEWLERHAVQYGKLVMHQSPTPAHRRQLHNHAECKAAAYLQDDGATLFVESDDRQATRIHELTKKPVLCIDSMKMYS